MKTHAKEFFNASEGKSSIGGKSYFYVFVDKFDLTKNNAKTLTTASNSVVGSSATLKFFPTEKNLDLMVKEVFEMFKKNFPNDSFVKFESRYTFLKYFHVDTMPAFSVVNHKVKEDTFEQQNDEPKWYDLTKWDKGRYVTFQRDILNSFNENGYALYTFVRDIHFKILQGNISAVNKRFALKKVGIVGGKISKAAQNGITTGRKVF
jgi:hypothetical protein